MTREMASFHSPSTGSFHASGSGSPLHPHPPHTAVSTSSSSSSSHHSSATSIRSNSGRPLPSQPYPHPESPQYPITSQPSFPSISSTSTSSSSLTATGKSLPVPPVPAQFSRPPHLYPLPESAHSSSTSVSQTHASTNHLDTSFRNLEISRSGSVGALSAQPSEDGHSAIGRAGTAAEDGGNGATRRPSAGGMNPLEDLIESEGRYVGELGMIIKTVAGAWSRENLPAPSLDGMFRSIEGVWKINRGFHSRLQQIGTSPSSPKVLGDLLMKWVDDMAPVYFRYSSQFYPNFSSLSSVSDNKRLPEILASLPAPQLDGSATFPPCSPSAMTWSLDDFFQLPRRRVRYYRELYGRLLRSTREGRSDHRLLISAVERLEVLERELGTRMELDLNGGHPKPAERGEDGQNREEDGARPIVGNPQARPTEKELLIRRMREEGPGERISTTSTIFSDAGESHTRGPGGAYETPRSSTATSLNSLRDPASPPQQKPKRSDLIQTVIARGPDAEVSPPIDSRTITPVERYNAPPLTDLEVRLDTERTIDLFSMQPKPCKLQMRPPSLSFTRKLRTSADATLYFTPTSTRREVVHSRAHIFVLTDLFLMCELMTVTDKVAKAQAILKSNPSRAGDGGPLPEMWLLYPPLAGRHLSVLTGSQENEMIVEVMKKERFLIQVENREAREDMMQQLKDCIQFASSVAKSAPVPARTGSNPTSPRIDIQSESPMHSRPGSTDTSHSGGQTLSFPGWMMAPPPRNASLRSPTLSNHSYGRQGDGRTISPKSTPPTEWQPSQLPQRTVSRQRQTSQSSSSVHHGPLVELYPSGDTGPPQPGQVTHVQSGHAGPMRPEIVRPGQHMGGYGAPLPRNGPRGNQPLQDPYPASESGGTLNGHGLMGHNGQPLRKTPSHANLGRHTPLHPDHAPPMPHHTHSAPPRSRSADPVHPGNLPPHPHFLGNGVHHSSQPPPMRRIPSEDLDQSPPASPMDEEAPRMTGQAVISAQMKCKVFLKQGHQQWKSLGAGRLILYVETGPRTVKQLCVEADSRGATMLISTIVLTDGVERVGKTGVAIDISDARGGRTGVVYMLQLRNEESARGLFDGLLAGSDRAR